MPGIYHITNAAKFRIEEAFVQRGFSTLTCPEIAEITGMPAINISRLMSHYHERGYGYFIRLKKRKGHAYQYKLAKRGRLSYTQYLKRIKLGFDLSLQKRTPARMSTFKGLRKLNVLKEAENFVSPAELAPYIGISKRGAEEMGIVEESKLEVAGLRNIGNKIN